MRDHGLVGRTRRRRVKTTISGATAQCAPNILDRAFYADGPDKKWVTDITYLPTQEGWLYLAAIIDLFSRKVVGYAMANNMEVGLATRALQRAIGTRRPLKGTLHHSDQGSQFTSKTYRALLSEYGLVCSMSRRGQCWDNSVAESFFGRLKEELMPLKGWASRKEAETAVAEYIDVFYNCQRVQKRLGYLCPIEYELGALVAKGAA